jgi:hypothetical protein
MTRAATFSFSVALRTSHVCSCSARFLCAPRELALERRDLLVVDVRDLAQALSAQVVSDEQRAAWCREG